MRIFCLYPNISRVGSLASCASVRALPRVAVGTRVAWVVPGAAWTGARTGCGRADNRQPVDGVLHAARGGGGIELARESRCPAAPARSRRSRTSAPAGIAPSGGWRLAAACSRGSAALGSGSPGFAFQQHVGQVGLGGGKPASRRPFQDRFGLAGVALNALALAQHHRDIAHGGDVLELQVPPDLERLLVIPGVISGDAGVEDGGDFLAGTGHGLAAQRQDQTGCQNRQNLVHRAHVGAKATLPETKLLWRRMETAL